MKQVLLKSVFDAFDYVLQHYYPAGLSELVERSDTYAVISIQDTHTGGFGFTFAKNEFCKDVLTLYFDDITREVEGVVLFSDEMARQIIDFIETNVDVDPLLCRTVAFARGGCVCGRDAGRRQFDISGAGRDQHVCVRHTAGGLDAEGGWMRNSGTAFTWDFLREMDRP